MLINDRFFHAGLARDIAPAAKLRKTHNARETITSRRVGRRNEVA